MSLSVFLHKAGMVFIGCSLMSTAIGQANYLVKGQVYVDDGYSTGIAVKINQNGNNSLTVGVRPDGTFQTSVEWNKVYSFQFIKKGYVSKVIEFSTVLPDSKNRSSIEPYNLKVRLFKLFEGVDTVFFNNPVAKIRYDKELGDFDYDMDYTLSIKYRVDEMRKKAQMNKGTGRQSASSEPVKESNARKPLSKSRQNTQAQTWATQHATGERVLPQRIDKIPNTDIPPLKENYKPGRTIEHFDLKSKSITRIIVVRGNTRNVYLKVRHNWGAVYYFHDETPLTFRCITRQVYERETGVDETIQVLNR